MPNVLSAAGAAFLRHAEGFVDHWYADAVGVGTIGIGFTWRSAAFRAWWEKNKRKEEFGPGAQMTKAEAEVVLPLIVAEEYGAAVNKFFGKKVTQNLYDGTVSPVFNLGPGSLNWKWATALKSGHIAEAAKLLRTTGTTAKGKPLTGLKIRRREEAELIQFGDYDYNTRVYADAIEIDAMADGMLVKGERGAQVLTLQDQLKRLKLYDGKVDGLFGHGTEAAVLAFQRAYGLVVDGKAGGKTLDAIEAALAPPDKAPETVTVTTPVGKPTVSVQPPPDTRNRLWIVLGTVGAAIIAAIVSFIKNGGQVG